jgi:hypothetical protein
MRLNYCCRCSKCKAYWWFKKQSTTQTKLSAWCKACFLAYNQEQRRSNPKVNLKERLVHRMSSVLGRMSSEECLRLLGLPTWTAVSRHLLSTLPDGATWKDCQIDHIQPFSSAITREQLMMCCHYTNLALLTEKAHKQKSAYERRKTLSN